MHENLVRKKEVARLLTVSAVFGFLFPIAAFIIVNINQSISFVALLKTNLLFDIICLAPLFLPLIAYVAANRILKYFDALNKNYEEQKIVFDANYKFVNEISNQNFNAILTSGDDLAKALLNMKTSLQNAQQKKEEENWIQNGVSEVGEILRKHRLIAEMSDELIPFLTKKINAVQCAFYIVNWNDTNKKLSTITLVGSYAYNRKKYLEKEFRFAQGLVGQTVALADIIYRTEIPEDYVSITSGLLGDKKPTSIILVPLITNEKVYAVIELASLFKLTEQQINFLKAIGDIIARTIFNISVNENTLKLLHDAQKMSTELEGQREQLIANAQEMSEAKENLEVTNEQLNQKIQEVNDAGNRQNALLERASEIISIYEENGTIKYISPSIKNILGYNSQELIDNNDQRYLFNEDKSTFAHYFDSSKNQNAKSFVFQYRSIKKDESVVWMEGTLTNLLQDTSIKGLVLNSRDITEELKAKEEQRMRAKMQALSENSPDLIIRLDLNGNLLYTNPVIETITNYKLIDFKEYNLESNYLPVEITEAFTKLISKIKTDNNKQSLEVNFEINTKPVYFTINAIPEYNQKNSLETILLVLHNITSQKQNEEIILEKNKKITESINYSYRIQSSLMPTEEQLQAEFPNAFMFYLPKDVVSGDFPFLYKEHEYIYIAAVDCTGHGVPGALMSFIGYFTLNQILSKHAKQKNAAEVLDMLHTEVQIKLKQDVGQGDSKDGMDIALIKVNTKKNIMEFAGAHRSMYLIKDGNFEEVKADRYPIAGMHYKTRKPFVNNVFSYKKGDGFVINTDGLPDQFGGHDGKQKFMSRKLRELVEANKSESMTDLKKILSTNFYNWKGNTKQMDDVLAIGVKF